MRCAREERISLELVLKLEIALSNVEESDDSRGFRTGSSKNAVRHEAEPATRFERCSKEMYTGSNAATAACSPVPSFLLPTTSVFCSDTLDSAEVFSAFNCDLRIAICQVIHLVFG